MIFSVTIFNRHWVELFVKAFIQYGCELYYTFFFNKLNLKGFKWSAAIVSEPCPCSLVAMSAFVFEFDKCKNETGH